MKGLNIKHGWKNLDFQKIYAEYYTEDEQSNNP